VHGAVRSHKSSRQVLGLAPEELTGRQRSSPGWCNARYLREVDWLTAQRAPRQTYLLLGVFALLDEQFGYCTDVGLSYRQTFGQERANELLLDLARNWLTGGRPVHSLTQCVIRPYRKLRAWLKTALTPATTCVPHG